jgi:hypothetical protein
VFDESVLGVLAAGHHIETLEAVARQRTAEAAAQSGSIPADFDRLVVCNHSMTGTATGYPRHLEPSTGFGGFPAYDLRNHGFSGSGNGTVGIGLFEYCDVIGSLRYAKSRADMRNMKTGLLSVCLACVLAVQRRYGDC